MVHKNVAINGLARQGLKPQCPFCKGLNFEVNGLATLFKRQTISVALEKFCQENDIDLFHLHHNKEVRWTPSTYRSLMNVMANWKTIVTFLQELRDRTTDKDLKATLDRYLKVLCDKNFLALLALGELSWLNQIAKVDIEKNFLGCKCVRSEGFINIGILVQSWHFCRTGHWLEHERFIRGNAN